MEIIIYIEALIIIILGVIISILLSEKKKAYFNQQVNSNSFSVWALVKGKWMHVVFTRMKLFVDGVQAEETATTAIWQDRDLTKDEIDLLFNSGDGLAYSGFDGLKDGLKEAWEFNETSSAKPYKT